MKFSTVGVNDSKTLMAVNLGKDDMLLWSVGEVLLWLESIGMTQYQGMFRDNQIKGEHLPLLTEAQLKDVWLIDKYHVYSTILVLVT